MNLYEANCIDPIFDELTGLGRQAADRQRRLPALDFDDDLWFEEHGYHDED